MTSTEKLIADVYAAFNRRDVEAALSRMGEGVSWPKASEGGRVVGKTEIRAYWGRQWEDFNPQVEPVEVKDEGEGVVCVRVHQVVRAVDGRPLFDGEVWHRYTIENGVIERMDLCDAEGDGQARPSAAFSHS